MSKVVFRKYELAQKKYIEDLEKNKRRKEMIKLSLKDGQPFKSTRKIITIKQWRNYKIKLMTSTSILI